MSSRNERHTPNERAARSEANGTHRDSLAALPAMNANWPHKAWVRQPFGAGNGGRVLKGLPYSVGATPVLQGLDLTRVDREVLEKVLALEAIRHWRSVGAYELHIVGRTCQMFLDEDLPHDLVTALGHVGIDEGHHFLAGQQEVQWLQDACGVALSAAAISLPTAKGTSSLMPIEVQTAALVAELTTSATFRVVPEDGAVDAGVREAIRSHRQDEGRHRAVFRMALAETWARSGSRERGDLSEALIAASSGLGSAGPSDIAHWGQQLGMLVSPAAASTILERLAQPKVLGETVKSSGLHAELARAGVLAHGPTLSRFKRAGLVER